MATPSTCWTVIRDAAGGQRAAQEEFARRYEPVIRAYLGARWRGSACLADLDDAVQDAFVDCLRPDGPLSRADPDRPAGFRAFLFGVVRNVALMTERRRARTRVRPAHATGEMERVSDDSDAAERAFERAWAVSVIQAARARHQELAAQRGEAAQRRVELLRLRFEDGLPIRDIARRWGEDAARLHREYAAARRESRAALHAVVAFDIPEDEAEADRECRRLLESLG